MLKLIFPFAQNSIIKGFTLIELMVSVSIVAILTAIAAPSFSDFIVEMRVDNEISRLQRLLLTARNHAITMQSPVTLCPLNEQNQCTSQWQDEIGVFIDSNDNKIYEPASNEVLIAMKDFAFEGDRLQYGLRRNRIKFAPTGRTTGWGSNGTLKYCPRNHNDHSRAIVISTSGRFYSSRDINGDGRDQIRNGGNIICR
ncbi:hypothetical protein A9Q74_04030 [Colwellia sp. 39_35_sub15_T18]|nr:hypothetical protein A9Q74_04030 [Colwellia sp. 39_35_sub15_T18]